jgi:hypothetical protein
LKPYALKGARTVCSCKKYRKIPKQNQASVKLVVRAIKIMIGRKVFSGAKKKTSLAATNRIEKQPIKWVEFFRNINCEGDLLGQNSSLRTKA